MARQTHFGAGRVTLKPQTANATPIPLGIIQEASVDFGFDIARLIGENNFPEDLGRKGGKISGKAKLGAVNGALYQEAFFNSSSGVVTGSTRTADRVPATIPATPFQVTPTVPGSGTYVEDQGVIDVTTATVMKRVASSPATGQYAVNESTGQYTFAAADTGKAVLISFDYTLSTGFTVSIENAVSGNVVPFTFTLWNARGINGLWVRLHYCIGMKLTFPFTNEDFMKHDFEFEAASDPLLGPGKISFTNA